MTTTLFVRHGESTMNQNWHLVGGRSNHTPLSPLGEQQAVQFGYWLRDEGVQPEAVYSAGTVRTDSTGWLALRAAGIKLPIERDERLQEMSQGRFEGKPRLHVYTPEMVAYLEAAGLTGSLPGGESTLDVQLRMMESLENMHVKTPEGIVLVFGHGLAIRALAGKINNLTKPQILSLTTDNLSVTRIDSTAGEHEVVYVGENVIGA